MQNRKNTKIALIWICKCSHSSCDLNLIALAVAGRAPLPAAGDQTSVGGTLGHFSHIFPSYVCGRKARRGPGSRPGGEERECVETRAGNEPSQGFKLYNL